MARVTLTGQPGPQGPKGDTGATGATGPAGAAATVAVGTVTTGEAGSSASVVNTGTSSAAVFSFTIPKGDKGDPGANGSGAGSLFVGAVLGTTVVSSQTINVGDPYTAGNPTRTYTTIWLPGASDAQTQNSNGGGRRGRPYSSNETYYYSALTTDVCLMLAAPRNNVVGFEHYNSLGSGSILFNASTSESNLNTRGWTSNPAVERRVIYFQQDATGGRQVLLSPIPNGGQPLIDTTPHAVSRVELEWANFFNGWTLVSAPGSTVTTYRPSGPQWIPMSRRDAAMSRFTAYYHRDTPLASVDASIAFMKHTTTSFTTLMGPSQGRLWTFLYGPTDQVWKPAPPFLTPNYSGNCQVAGIIGGITASGATIADYFSDDDGASFTTNWTATTATTPSTGGGVIGRSTSLGNATTPPFAVQVGILHELMHPLDNYLGLLAGFTSPLSLTGYLKGLWDSYIKVGAAGYGTPNQATISGTLRSGARIAPSGYASGSELEFFAEAVAALYYWNSTGDYHGLRMVFGAHVYLQTFAPTRDNYWVDRTADLVIKDFVDWFRTNVDSSIGTYTPVPAGTTPPVFTT